MLSLDLMKETCYFLSQVQRNYYHIHLFKGLFEYDIMFQMIQIHNTVQECLVCLQKVIYNEIFD